VVAPCLSRRRKPDTGRDTRWLLRGDCGLRPCPTGPPPKSEDLSAAIRARASDRPSAATAYGSTSAMVWIRTPRGSPTGTSRMAVAFPGGEPVTTGAKPGGNCGRSRAARREAGANPRRSISPAMTSDVATSPERLRRLAFVGSLVRGASDGLPTASPLMTSCFLRTASRSASADCSGPAATRKRLSVPQTPLRLSGLPLTASSDGARTSSDCRS